MGLGWIIILPLQPAEFGKRYADEVPGGGGQSPPSVRISGTEASSLKRKQTARAQRKCLRSWISTIVSSGGPPTSKGDYAFALHMLSSLDGENGRMAVVLPHGILFRGASEGKIQRQLVEMNLLDAVIGLPANLFYGTGIPACIVDGHGLV